MPIVKKLICYECALKKTNDRQQAINLSEGLRVRVLAGWNVTCEECREMKSIWKKPVLELIDVGLIDI